MTSLPGEQAPSPASRKPATPSNLTQRLLTGAIALPVALLAAFAGGWWFGAFALLLACIGVMEFCALGRGRGVEGSSRIGVLMTVAVLLGVQLSEPALWLGAFAVGVPAVFVLQTIRDPKQPRRNLLKAGTTLVAVLYVAVPAALLVATRNLPSGLTWLLILFCLTWGTDSFAYIGGRLWGRTKLAPHISPKKTVEGAVIGIVGGILPAALVLGVAGEYTPLALVPLAAGPLLAILGDLVESGFKRVFDVKDSHLIGFDILPGHGGVLDRVDGLILVTIFTYVFLQLTGIAG